MTLQERKVIDDLVVRLRALLTASEFGTPEQATEIEDIADEFSLLIQN